MKKTLFFILAVLTAAGLTVTGCKKGEEVKPVPKAEHKKGTKKKASSKKSTQTQSTKKKSSQKKGTPPESMM